MKFRQGKPFHIARDTVPCIQAVRHSDVLEASTHLDKRRAFQEQVRSKGDVQAVRVLDSIACAALLLGCSVGQSQGSACLAIAPVARIVEVGAFSDTRYTEEHAYGHTVMLWRAGDCFFGLFEYSQGVAGDTPIGLIQDAKYDPKTGSLSFTARLTNGMVSVQGISGTQPARDLFTFQGLLKASKLTGALTHNIENNSRLQPERANVTLVAAKDAAELMSGSTTYGAWQSTWQPVLNRRGPMWQ